MESIQNLVYYAAVFKNNVILADYHEVNCGEFVHMAAKCLEHIPPLHNRFSYTTNNRMFICLIEGLVICCAIMDKALSKATAFLFLEHVNDAFRVLLQQRDLHMDALTSYPLHHEMAPFFQHLALPLVGVPHREKTHIIEEECFHQTHRDAEHDYDASSPSAVAPLKEMSEEDFDLQIKCKPTTVCPPSPGMPCIGILEQGKKKTRDSDKEVISSPIDSSCEALNKSKGLDIMIDDNRRPERPQMHRPSLQATQDRWWCHVKLIFVLDLIVCLALLAIWLTVCKGVRCMKET